MSWTSGRRGLDHPRFIARALTGQSRLCAQFVLNLCDRLDGSEFQARSGCHGPAGSAPYTCPNLCHVTGWGWTVQGSIHSTPVLMVAVGTVPGAIKRGSLSLSLCGQWQIAIRAMKWARLDSFCRPVLSRLPFAVLATVTMHTPLLHPTSAPCWARPIPQVSRGSFDGR